jgi:hypothetical protein
MCPPSKAASGAELARWLSGRLRRVDLVSGERYLEDALPMAVGGTESLLKVGRRSRLSLHED